MKVYTCPLCDSATDADEEPFVEVDAVVAHIDDSEDERHEGERGSDYAEEIEDRGVEVGDANDSEPEDDSVTVSRDGDELLIVYDDGERPVGEVLEEIDDYVAQLDAKFKRVVQEQQNTITELRETIEAQKLAIQELQAGMKSLAEEHDKDVEYQFRL